MDSRKKLIAIAIGGLIVLAGGLIIALGNRGVNPDMPPEESTIREFTKYASIVGPTKTLLENIGGVVQFDMISLDLHYFGRVNYDKYKKGDSLIVGFSLDGSITKTESTVTFEGSYGASKNKINVSIELLANKRLKTSITDSKTGRNVDAQLPSNSKFNQFIAKLPVNQDQYSIEYSPSKDNVVVVLGEREPSIYQKALDYIKSQVDDGSLEQKKITALFPPSTFGQ